MTVVALDTGAGVKALIAAGFTDMQAEAVTRIVRPSQNVDLSELATKTDLQVGLAAAKADLAETTAGLEKPGRIQGGHVEMDAWRDGDADCCDPWSGAHPGKMGITLTACHVQAGALHRPKSHHPAARRQRDQHGAGGAETVGVGNA